MTAGRHFRVSSNRRLRQLLLGAVGVAVVGLMLVAYGTNLFKSLEYDTMNTRFSIRGTQKPAPGLVVVGVDAATFQALNIRWPFPRAVFGRVIDRIAAEHPAAIAVDVQFTERTSQNDEVALLQAIDDAHHKTVFAMTETNAKGGVKFLGSTEGNKLLHEVGGQPASALLPPDPGNFARRMKYSINGLRTVAVVTAEVAGHRKITTGDFPGGSAWINYPGPEGTVPNVSFSSAYGCRQCGKLPPHYFRNKVVVIGATATALQDVHATPTDPVMPGPEVQADAIGTALAGFPLKSVAGWVNIALIVALGVAVPLLGLRLRPVRMTAAAVALGALLAVAAQVTFDSGRVMSFVYPLAALILGFGGSLAVLLMTEAFERIRVRDMFSRFVPENVVDEVLASADGLRLGGVQRDGTVMFTDLRGFTSLAESMTPARVIETLNRYLSEMSDAILDHGGTLVAYMGDGIMAVFGAPLAQDDHADRAVAAAREMIGVRLPKFNAWLRGEGLSDGFKMGIGLNSGHVMSGHVGSERRVEYTAVGDTTNTASRIEALTKGTPYQLLLSDFTKEALREPIPDLVFHEETEIRGRKAKMKLWSLAETSVEPVAAETGAAEPAEKELA
jgi:adenylate cyclase